MSDMTTVLPDEVLPDEVLLFAIHEKTCIAYDTHAQSLNFAILFLKNQLVTPTGYSTHAYS
jgi:hypothetical protein